jgi:hypothetical protein
VEGRGRGGARGGGGAGRGGGGAGRGGGGAEAAKWRGGGRGGAEEGRRRGGEGRRPRRGGGGGGGGGGGEQEDGTAGPSALHPGWGSPRKHARAGQAVDVEWRGHCAGAASSDTLQVRSLVTPESAFDQQAHLQSRLYRASERIAAARGRRPGT